MDASPDTVGGEGSARSERAPLARRVRGLWRPDPAQAHHPAALRAHRWKVARKLTGFAAVAAVVLATLLGAIVALMAVSRPGWWAPVPGDVARRLANDLESTLVEQASMVRPTAAGFVPTAPGEWRSDPWTVTITSEQATAWLNERFPAWLSNSDASFRWPEELNSLGVNFDDGKVRLGGELLINGSRRFVSVDLLPGIRDDGSLWAKAEWLRVGRLPLPAEWLLKRAAEQDGSFFLPEAGAAIQALAGEVAVAVSPALSLGDGRRVRVLAIQPRDGVIQITCRTDRNGK